MFTLQRVVCGLLVASVLALTGCMSPETAFSPFVNLKPEDVGATRANYRGYPCEHLPALIDEFQRQSAAAPHEPHWNWHVNAMKEVQVEKKCNMTPGSASPLPAASNADAAASAAEGSAIGVALEEQFTPTLAKALRLSSAKGALVKSTVAGSPAEKAGIKEMDVILQIGEVGISSGRHLADYTRQLPVGFKTKIQVWRDGNKLELPIQTVSVATLQSLMQKTPVTSAGNQSGSPASAESAPLVYGYCFHTDIESRKHWVSSVFEIAHSTTRHMGKEFDAVLRSANGVGQAASVCAILDTRDQASAQQQENKRMFWMSAKVIEVPWLPPRQVP